MSAQENLVFLRTNQSLIGVRELVSKKKNRGYQRRIFNQTNLSYPF